MKPARIAPALLLAFVLQACATGAPPSGDGFFDLVAKPLRSTGERGEASPPRPGLPAGYRVDLRFLRKDDGAALLVPSLHIRSRDVATVTVVNQLSFVQDFDLETAEDAWISDPVIGILQEGFRMDLMVTPAGDRMGFAWSIHFSNIDRPIPVQKVTVGDGTRKAVIQLPATSRVEASGWTILAPLEETLLATLPTHGRGTPALEVLARVTPVSLPFGPDEPVENGTDDAEAPVLAHARSAPVPEESGDVEVVLLLVREGGPSGPLHTTKAAGESLLRGLGAEPLRTFRLNSSLSPGTRLALQMDRSYVSDYDIEVNSTKGLADPEVATVPIGFEAELKAGETAPVLHWTYGSLAKMELFTTQISPDLKVTLQLPELIVFRGELPLRSPANMAPIADLDDGRRLLLLVRR